MSERSEAAPAVRRPWLMAGLGVALGLAAFVLSQIPNSRVWFHTIGPLHVWYHVGLFALLAFLAMQSSARWTIRLAGLLFTVVIGLAIEFGELRFAGILFEWADIQMDALGTLFGSAAGWAMARRTEVAARHLDVTKDEDVP